MRQPCGAKPAGVVFTGFRRQRFAGHPKIRVVAPHEIARLANPSARRLMPRRASAYLWFLTLGGFRRRTPGPPPFSSMNSTPARFFSIALAVLPRTAVAEIAGFDALAASYGCAALIANAKPPRPT